MSTEPASFVVRDGADGQPVMSLSLTCHGDVNVIVISGELDRESVHLLTELVHRVTGDGPMHVVLDMAGVTFFSAAGLTALLKARETVTGVGGQLLLRAASPVTRTVLTITDTAGMFLADPTAATT